MERDHSPEAFQGTRKTISAFNRVTASRARSLYAALVQSDNIAAYTLAYHVVSVGTSVEAGAKLTPADMFVAQMNALTKR